MARHPMQVVSLIGMPGSGKSTVGVLLAKRLGLAFVDTDLLIQEQEQATLSEIIAARGHEALRVIEEQVLLDMGIGASVISTGWCRILRRLASIAPRLDTLPPERSKTPHPPAIEHSQLDHRSSQRSW